MPQASPVAILYALFVPGQELSRDIIFCKFLVNMFKYFSYLPYWTLIFSFSCIINAEERGNSTPPIPRHERADFFKIRSKSSTRIPPKETSGNTSKGIFTQ